MLPARPMTTRAKVLLPLCLIALVALSVHRLGQRPPEAVMTTLRGETMGTVYLVTVVGQHPESELQAAVDEELSRIDRLMSTYKPDSELSRFNRHESTEPFGVSADTAKVAAAARRISEQSDGAFDVTVGPLVALWGFGAGAQVNEPTDEALAQTREHVGYRKLIVELEPPSLRKLDPRLRVDLSAIAKGYAVDQVAELLRARGAGAFLVEVGGEVRVQGLKPNAQRWQLGIERPSDGERAVQRVVELTDTAMATSGDYRNYYERDGVRVSHTIDPRTGRPITHALASVTVLHESAMYADGYATALNVLGPNGARQVADAVGLPMLMIIRSAGGFEVVETSKFSQRIESQVAP